MEVRQNLTLDPKNYKFKAPENFSLNAQKKTNVPAKSGTKKKNWNSSGVVMNTMNNSNRLIPRIDTDSIVGHSACNGDVKQLLGELYVDKEYLENFINDKDFVKNSNERIMDLVSSGLNYLEARTEFWRQQKPIYARKRDASLIHAKIKDAKQRQLERDSKREKSPQPKQDAEKKDVMKAFEAAVSVKDTAKIIALGSHYIRKYSENQKHLARIYIDMGVAQFNNGDFVNSEKSFISALNVKIITDEKKLTCLGHLGRVQVKLQRFQDALKTWTETINLSKDPVEKAWLYHDSAICYKELKDKEKMIKMVELACTHAEESKEPRWIFNTSLLAAQNSESDQLKHYQKALEYAKILNETKAVESIQKTIDALQ